jgi:hypothetical protein
MRSIIKGNFTFMREDGNTNLIISSHGGHTNSPFTTPVTLKFPARQNYCATGQVTRIRAMADNEFETERIHTGGLTDYTLSNFEDDEYASLVDVVRNGFDVVTIKKKKTAKLTDVLGSPEIGLFGYKTVYCMFCRVALQPSRVKVMF